VTANAIVFIGITIIFGAAAVLAWFGMGQLALSGSGALERDGIGRGRRAPAWSLADSEGNVHSSPPAGGTLQLLLFADHSLKSFPSVLDGLRQLTDVESTDVESTDLEIVVVTRGPGEGAAELLGQLGLRSMPVLAGSPRLYGQYNVRVMPFAIFVGSDGLVRASSLVNHDWQLVKLCQIAAIPPAEDGPGAARRRRAFGLAV